MSPHRVNDIVAVAVVAAAVVVSRTVTPLLLGHMMTPNREDFSCLYVNSQHFICLFIRVNNACTHSLMHA